MQNIIIVGASGFGREVAWLIERINIKTEKWNILGYLDDNELIQNNTINGYKVLGRVCAVTEYPDAQFVCAVGAANTRRAIVDKILDINPKAMFATLVDPSVEMSDYVSIGEGSIICAHTILTVNITIGKHVIINLDCTIGHDVVIDDYVTLYPSVNVSGGTRIGNSSELGTGMQIIQGKSIGSEVIAGAGAVVINDIIGSCTVVGVPGKIVDK